MTTKLLRASIALALPLMVAMTTSADRDVDRNSPVRKSPPGSTIKLVNPAPAKVPSAAPKAKAPAQQTAAPAPPAGGVARSVHDWQPGSLNKQGPAGEPKKAATRGESSGGGSGGSEKAVEIDPKDAPGFP